MSLHIIRDPRRGVWHVTPDPPEALRGGAIASFATLHEAEQYVIEHADEWAS